MDERSNITEKPYYLSTTALFILGGLLIGLATYGAFIPQNLRIFIQVGMMVASLASWILLSQSPQLRNQKLIAAGFFSVSLGVLLARYFGNLPLEALGFSVDTPQGIAIAKFGEAFFIVLPILVVHIATGGDMDGLFLNAGNVKVGLIGGLLGFVGFAGLGALQALGSNLRWETVSAALPWIMIFIFSNAFMEELWFRALFLRKLEPEIGWPTTLLATSFVFASVHINVTYVLDIAQFMLMLLALGLIWAWLMRKANSIWGPVLFHAGGDILVMVGFLASTSG